MGRVRGIGEFRVCWTIGLALACGCAGGESESVGNISQTAGFPQAEGSTGLATTENGPTSDESTTDPAETTSGPSSLTSSTDPSTTLTDPSTTTGPPVACMFADACDDADPCTEDNCVNSVCVNAPLDCDDAIECTIDSCDASGACVHEADDTACDDADACNGVETCSVTSDCQDGTPVMCTDANACTADTCQPATGTCEFDPIETCSGGTSDGCCPVGCSVAADADCTCTNLTGDATASSSGGGADPYGPESWIDGADETVCSAACANGCFGWITNTSIPEGAYLQLDWDDPVTIGSMFLDSTGDGNCNANRPLAGGTVRYWSAGSWITADTFAGESGNFDLSFDPPFTTTRVQIYNAVTSPGSSPNSIVFEWYVYGPPGCAP